MWFFGKKKEKEEEFDPVGMTVEFEGVNYLILKVVVVEDVYYALAKDPNGREIYMDYEEVLDEDANGNEITVPVLSPCPEEFFSAIKRMSEDQG